MIEMLQPGYKPPKHVIGGDLIDSVHSKIIEHMKTGLDHRAVTVMQDVWSDIQNTPVIAGSVHNGEKSYFISAFDTSTNKKTADSCATLAKDTFRLLQSCLVVTL